MGPTGRFAPSARDTVLTRNRNDSKDKSDELFLTSSRMERPKLGPVASTNAIDTVEHRLCHECEDDCRARAWPCGVVVAPSGDRNFP
jgi:hypothetical protein